MAETIGLATGLLALTSFALNSSVTLCNTIQSFKHHSKRARDLHDELDDLNGVLKKLTETVSTTVDAESSGLEHPLRRCGSACKEFEQEILKCTSRTGENRKSFRDWAKLMYMGDNIDGFRQTIAGYKATINIALVDANLRKTSVTAELLENYKDLIEKTTEDLGAHLRDIDDKLENMFERTAAQSEPDTTQLELKDERLSTQKCLEICARLTEHINEIQFSTRASSSSSGSAHDEAGPEEVFKEGLQGCHDSLSHTKTKLEKLMKDKTDKLIEKSQNTMSSEEVEDLARLRDEWETTRQNIEIISKAKEYMKDNVSTIDNYATGDAVQFLVSTTNQTVHGRNHGTGWRTRQVGGHLNDESLQHITRLMSTMQSQDADDDPSSQVDTPTGPNDPENNGSGRDFSVRYGKGVQLVSRSTDGNTPGTTPGESSNSSSSSR